PETRAFSPGSVLSFLNTQSAWEQAREVGKPLRFSFGRADREYKDRWCNPETENAAKTPNLAFDIEGAGQTRLVLRDNSGNEFDAAIP
ncbi:hypothetical protein Q6332_28090, partial [Klebsiella pneumoniae]|nr:hypothetical protein [Klebsiella pneumoniae]